MTHTRTRAEELHSRARAIREKHTHEGETHHTRVRVRRVDTSPGRDVRNTHDGETSHEGEKGEE